MEKLELNRTVSELKELPKEYTVKDVRVLMIQNIMGYNNTQPRSYWYTQDNKTLLANVGLADRLFFERLLYYAEERETLILSKNEKENA